MRKTLLVITVLLVATQAYAGTVTMSVDDEGDRWAAIRYSADANVSAFGLKVTADSGALFTDINDYNVGESTAGNLGYGIFPGTIDINEDTGLVDNNGTPVAPNDDPGAAGTGYGTGTLILEMGALYEDGNEPAQSGTLIKVKVDGDCIVCVETEPIRGNVVLTDGSEATVVYAPNCVSLQLCHVPDVVGDPCDDAIAEIIANGFNIGDITTEYNDVIPWKSVISTDPAYCNYPGCGTDVDIVVSEGSDCYIGQDDEDEWDKVGRPTCWCYSRQCHGDADGLKTTGFPPFYWVYLDDLQILVDAWQKEAGDLVGNEACADFDHLPTTGFPPYYRVYLDDLQILVDNWQIDDPLPDANCEPGNRTP